MTLKRTTKLKTAVSKSILN